jgi:anti-sigma-K factor RskA
MRYRNKPELQDRLAAEYVLGTLRGRARLRFEAGLREDAALRRAVQEWESRLAPMAEAVPERVPPQRVWERLQGRIAAPAAAAVSPSASFWDSLAFWRNWGLIATGCTAALVGALALRAPQVVEVPVIRQVEVESRRMQPSYIAVLQAAGEKDDRMMFVAYAPRHSDELWVKRMELPEEPHNHSYELWGLPAKEGEPPVSLGVLPSNEKSTIKLAAAADQSLRDFPALAITVEPLGGAKGGKSSGIVVAKGHCMRFW